MKVLILGILLFCASPVLRAQAPCLATDTLKIVVIGSSTAAGSGASTGDSAWVNRYRNFLQGINPDNQVVNLARGGYNTWRLMPDYFNPPPNRPFPDTLRNISHALRQNPDGIIINLPSNDAAIGTGTSEQMTNFIHMDSLAASQGVPVWVCTTQPRNFNAAGTFIQVAVRDSILAYFGHRAIDFWTGLADPFNNIDTTYDSGDGVHLNDLGHRLLYNRVVQKQIPDSLVSMLPGLDLWPKSIQWLNPSTCGNSLSVFRVQIANLRQDSLSGVAQVNLLREDLNTGLVDTIHQALNNIAACAYTSVDFSLNTAPQQAWRLWAEVSSPQDSNASNNSSPYLLVRSSSIPSLNVSDRNFCRLDSLSLQASSSDSLFWFADSLLQNQLTSGSSYFYGLAQNDTLFLQARRGPFVFKEQVQAAQSSNINWNGTMFNLIATNQTVVLDSILFYSGTSANVQVNLRTKTGSYQGAENDPSLWSTPLSDSVYNAQADSAYFLNFGAITINPGDTLGCYLYLENASHRLRYQSAGSRFTYQGTALSIDAGSGIAHTFGTIYHPRHINAEFFYHYGLNPLGQCQSEVGKMVLKESEARLDLGPDTIHDNSLDLILPVPAGFSNAYWWLSPQAGDSLVIPAFSFNDSDSLWVVLSAEDSLGCMHTDSLLVIFSEPLKLHEKLESKISIYPNPSSGRLSINTDFTGDWQVEILNAQGQLQGQYQSNSPELNLNLNLAPGFYWLHFDREVVQTLLIEP